MGGRRTRERADSISNVSSTGSPITDVDSDPHIGVYYKLPWDDNTPKNTEGWHHKLVRLEGTNRSLTLQQIKESISEDSSRVDSFRYFFKNAGFDEICMEEYRDLANDLVPTFEGKIFVSIDFNMSSDFASFWQSKKP